MEQIEELMTKAVKDGTILGAVLLAKDKSGNSHSPTLSRGRRKTDNS